MNRKGKKFDQNLDIQGICVLLFRNYRSGRRPVFVNSYLDPRSFLVCRESNLSYDWVEGKADS